jgi:hypothetical protein
MYAYLYALTGKVQSTPLQNLIEKSMAAVINTCRAVHILTDLPEWLAN